tara:strand:+ start:4082 stop:4387 length:306 start_codon:yes stop_codon:yes gene_type:complete
MTQFPETPSTEDLQYLAQSLSETFRTQYGSNLEKLKRSAVIMPSSDTYIVLWPDYNKLSIYVVKDFLVAEMEQHLGEHLEMAELKRVFTSQELDDLDYDWL